MYEHTYDMVQAYLQIIYLEVLIYKNKYTNNLLNYKDNTEHHLFFKNLKQFFNIFSKKYWVPINCYIEILLVLYILRN